MNLFSSLEFHRTGIGLLPDPHEPDPGSAVHLAKVAGSQRPLTFCSCSAGRRSSCHHLKELRRQIELFHDEAGGRHWGELFAASRWHALAQLLFEGEPQGFDDARVLQEKGDGPLRVLSESDIEILRYLEHSPAAIRFLERTGKTPKRGSFADRSGLIDRLSTFLRSPEEQHLNKAGLKTNRQSFEESLWSRVAYHCFREHADAGSFEPRVELRTGEVFLTFFAEDGEAVLQVRLAREQVGSVLSWLRQTGGNPGRQIPRPVASIDLFDSGPGTEMPEERRQAVSYLVAYGREEILEDEDRERFRYGDLLFLSELECLIELESSEAPADRGFEDTERLDLESARIETFETEPPDPSAGELVLDDPMADLGIYTEFDYMELIPDEYEEEGHSLSIRYGFGEEEVNIGDLLRAKKSGQPYYQTDSGWIDLNAPALRGLGSLLRRKGLIDGLKDRGQGERVRLSSAELLRLRASSAKPIRVEGPKDRSEVMERFLELRPAEPLTLPVGLKSELRPYQKLGLEWLKFLYENRLAGLLCDDMGLGKTHQAMALMVLVREQMGIKEPFLVVAPRTVISHWRNKIREYAPVLGSVQYHGPQRNLKAALSEGDVLLTSYGVLRNDIGKFKDTMWGLVIFDEIQQIKNRATQGYKAAEALRARMKLGLTGTPIENSLSELKGLFDLILPGYLGSEEDFRDRYGAQGEADVDSWHLASLRRLTSPFVLRRVKTAVLDELPEKIEDVRTCSLSPEQLQLYRSTIATRGVALMEKLRTKSEPLPYIHIFALLNMLKQICDHPALALNAVDQYQDFDSGKWELFQELLAESLDSGQKVVVFSQYLGMIAIMEHHLEQLGVESVTLTGASRNRGAIVDRFNDDPKCRVFLGSLRAGGTGIDLIGGSVVIHYDRWWNAAREDQATDRLYRIGQKRVVQVFKLVTEDTLEERIAMIIDNKRRLMTSVVQEDDPKLSKLFSREELMELLRDPEER